MIRTTVLRTYEPRVTVGACGVFGHPELVVDELIRHARSFTLQLAESYLTGSLFRQILGRIERLAWHLT